MVGAWTKPKSSMFWMHYVRCWFVFISMFGKRAMAYRYQI